MRNKVIATDAALRVAAMTVAGIVASLTVCAPTVSAEPTPQPNATVIKVIDGDTITVASDERGRLKVRLIGLDSPETVKPKTSVGCFGPEASQFAHRMLDGQRVALVSDSSQGNTDKFGRTLAFVFLPNGQNFSVESVREGYAHAYVFNHTPSRYAEQIAAAEQEARDAHRGLWSPATCDGHTDSVSLEP
ncbi:thermonuclease family protein [Mycobacteroides abscessus]|uniref:thermonuclease family protein n=1 Tax=Mycobacteroides abscessus TaxID=36809 RepID=UPI000942489F|nr:thermonuclease family protein [Mycobacteroides abscessus]